MTKKYTFEQVIRLLKKHANDAEPYVFEYPECDGKSRQRAFCSYGLSGCLFFEFYEVNKNGYTNVDSKPYCRDGWELARPVKAKRERILIGTVPRASVIGLSGMIDELVLTDIQDGDYDLYAVKR
jgi:hypothetical protein